MYLQVEKLKKKNNFQGLIVVRFNFNPSNLEAKIFNLLKSRVALQKVRNRASVYRNVYGNSIASDEPEMYCN